MIFNNMWTTQDDLTRHTILRARSLSDSVGCPLATTIRLDFSSYGPDCYYFSCSPTPVSRNVLIGCPTTISTQPSAMANGLEHNTPGSRQ